MGVSENSGFSPQIIHFNGVSIINHPFWGFSSIFWKHPYIPSILWVFGYRESLPQKELPKARPKTQLPVPLRRSLRDQEAEEVVRDFSWQSMPTMAPGTFQKKRQIVEESHDPWPKWFFNDFFCFIPLFGVSWSNLTSIFFRWVGSTTNQDHVLRRILEIKHIHSAHMISWTLITAPLRMLLAFHCSACL